MKFKIGDVVKICPYDDMQELLSCYETDLDPVELLSIAGLPAKVCWLPTEKEMATWDGLIAVSILNEANEASTHLIPVACIDELEDEIQIPIQEPIVIRDINSEHDLITQLAVETIQNAYR